MPRTLDYLQPLSHATHSQNLSLSSINLTLSSLRYSTGFKVSFGTRETIPVLENRDFD